jgi:hypothetical protein
MELKEAVLAHMEAEKGGSFHVRNGGGYVAKFSVTYKLHGQDFSKDSGTFTLGVNKAVDLPAGATDIHLKVEENWAFGWSTIFTKVFSEPAVKCYEIHGTTLNPKWKEVSC